VIAPLLTPIVITFWKLLSIPPQRLNVWILKARLSSMLQNLKRHRRAYKDIRYLVSLCLSCLLIMILSLFLFIIAMAILFERRTTTAQHRHSDLPDLAMLFLFFVNSYAGVLFAHRLYVAVLNATRRYESVSRRMICRVQLLRSKIQLKSQ
jgi:hypothetical protein